MACMAKNGVLSLLVVVLLSSSCLVQCEDPYLFYTWNVSYATLAPLGVPQRVITINGQFPGPKINGTSNNNVVVNVFNNLDEPLLFTWHGIQQRKNSWQDGTLGTNCPIPSGANFTYRFQVKDQIGSFYYYPTTALHRAGGGYGPISVHSRDLIPVPFDRPEDEFEVFVGDWYAKDHSELRAMLDSGFSIGNPDGVVINGQRTGESPIFSMIPGKTYRYRICNAGMKNSVNVRIQGHTMKLVETEGSHTVQNVYDSLDVHLSQCYSVLVTANQAPRNYYLVASTRFASPELAATALVGYVGGAAAPADPLLPPAPADVQWSLSQFRSLHWNLTASAARPNPQGSYHYGRINITRTVRLVGTSGKVGLKLRHGINGVSHVDPETPVKLAEYFGVADQVFKYDVIKDQPTARDLRRPVAVAPNVLTGVFRNFVEIVFENPTDAMQSYHLDGYAFFPVAIEAGTWAPEKRNNYNLIDAVSRHTVQVYPRSWAAVMTTLDNAGMWSLRSMVLENQYLGQQLYVSVQSPARSLRDEYNMFDTQLLCGIVKGMPNPMPYSGT